MAFRPYRDAAPTGKVFTGNNAKFGGEVFNEDGHEVADENNPEEPLVELGTAHDIGAEIPRIHVGHADDKRWAEESGGDSSDG